MNLKFIEGGQARHKVVKFRGVRIANKKVVVAEEHRGGGFRVAVLG